jgi:hypothetical protein
MSSIATTVRTNFGTNLAQFLNSTASLNEVWVQDLANPTTPVGVDSTAVPGTETNPGQLPASVAVVAQYHINRRYRGGHPRGYWPLFGGQNLATAGQWKATDMASLTTSLNAHITAIKAITAGVTVGNQCAVSYYAPGAWVNAANSKPKWLAPYRNPPLVDDVSQVTINPKPGSQRRRVRKA